MGILSSLTRPGCRALTGRRLGLQHLRGHDYLQLTGKRKTDADGLFTLETVACLGACGLSPVLTLDGEVHAKMTPDSALALLESIRKEELAK